MNSFCVYCTGNEPSEIIECEFIDCPFHQFRRADLEWQVIEREQLFEKLRHAHANTVSRSPGPTRSVTYIILDEFGECDIEPIRKSLERINNGNSRNTKKG